MSGPSGAPNSMASSSMNAQPEASTSSSKPSQAARQQGNDATSAASRLWSSWVSPSTTAQTAASSAFEGRRKPRRPTFEEFRAQEPPQARLIRLRGLFDVLMDKDDEQALAGGRAKQEWTRSATRARYGAGGIYARGSMAPKGSENGDVGGASSSSSGSSSSNASAESKRSSARGRTSSDTSSSPSASTPSSSTSRESTPSPPRQSYATELLTQCRECRAQLEKERQEMERQEKKRTRQREKEEKRAASTPDEGGSWYSWIPFLGDASKAPSEKQQEPSIVGSVKGKLTGEAGASSQSDKADAGRTSTSILSSISSTLQSVPLFGGEANSGKGDTLAHSTELHSDHEGEAGWIGSGVWGLSAVGQKQRQADRLLDEQIAAGRGKKGNDENAEKEQGTRQRQIEWEGFLRYADQKERELYKIFVELDRNCDMHLDIAEINQALDRAGIELSQEALEDFIASLSSTSRFKKPEQVRSITFPQFRDYLLLLPRDPSVDEIFRFYQVRKAFGLFGSQGIFAEFSGRWGRSERHGATSVTQDGDVSLAGEERKKPSDDEVAAKREARRAVKEARDEERGAEEGAAHANREGVAGSAAAAAGRQAAIDNAKTSTAHGQQGEGPRSGTGEQSETSDADHVDDEDSDVIQGSVAVKFLIAGGIAGAVSRTATAPFDRLKIYLITSSNSTATSDLLRSGDLSGSSTAKTATRGVSMLGDAVKSLYHEGGGLRAFWVGNGLNCLKIFPESAIKFLSYETAKRFFAKYVDGVSDSRDISGSSRFISGGFGGITSQFAIYPVETLKTRLMASQRGKSQGNQLLVKTAIDMWRSGGLRTYYRGLTAGLIGVFPYSAIDMSTFEGIKLFYIKYTGREEPGVLSLLAFGSISGSVGATTVYPLSLVRTRLQAAGTPAHPQTYDGFFDVARKTYKSEGVVGFYRGLIPSLAKVVPAVSISYVVYERSKQHLGVQ